MKNPHQIKSLRGGQSLKALLMLVCLASMMLAGSAVCFAQFTITEINPSQSSLDASDPDGASGGRINGLGSVANSNLIYYAASEWGGIYKSTDGGHQWSRLNAHRPTVTWDVEVSPAETNRVFATSFYDGRVSNSLSGINVSTDGGTTWTHPATAKPPAGFCKDVSRRDEHSAFGISVDPSNPKNVYVGTNCGLAVSNDAGNTWKYVDPTPANPADDVWDVVVHHNGIIDLCGDDGHRRSTNGGSTWTTASGIALPSGRCSIAASPDESYVLFAVVGTSIFETDNGGTSWTTQFANPSAQGRISFVATNQRPGAAFNLWFGDVRLWRADCTTPAPAAPGGAARCPASNTWAGGFTRAVGGHDDTGDIAFDNKPVTVVNPPSQACVNECTADRNDCMSQVGKPGGPLASQCVQQFNACKAHCPTTTTTVPNNDKCPVLLSSDGGVYFNTKKTAPDCNTPAWEQPDITPHGLWLFGMGGSDRAGASAEDLYFGNQDNGSFGTTNAGVNPPTWTNKDCCDGFDDSANSSRVLYTICCFTPAPANRLFLRPPGMAGGGFISTPPPGTLPGFRVVDVIDRFGPNHYVALTTSGIFITTNVAASPIVWTQIGAATTPAGACGVKAAGTSTSPTFYVEAGTCSGSGQDTLFRYTGTAPGSTWQQVQPPGGTGGFGIFAVDPNNANRLFASHITNALVEMIISTNGGTTWSINAPLNNLMTGGGVYKMRTTRGPSNFTGFGGYVQPSLVAFDPSDSKTLVAGGVDSGIFLSQNGGTSWSTITDNSGTAAKPHIPRPQFAYFDRENCKVGLYVGTQGRGVWRVSYSSDCPPPPPPDCLKECEADRNDCMSQVGKPGGPLASQCVQQFNACKAHCQ